MRVLPLAMVFTASIACASREPGTDEPEAPLVRLVASDLRFAAPDTIPPGLTRVRLVNDGVVWHEALITRLPEGASVDAYLAGARAGEAFPGAAVDVGGPGQIAAGDSSEVVLRLTPGRYAIVCWSDNHVKAGMIVPLVVSEVSGLAKSPPTPVAEAEVKLEEYRFAHAAPFRGGPQVLKVSNTGQRPHNLQVYRLDTGKTLRDFATWFATRQGAPPATPVGGVSTMAPGTEAWVNLDLEPGRYFIACGTLEDGKIHAQMGMIEEFEVPKPG